MQPKYPKEKLDAAYALLMEEKTSFGRIEKVTLLLKGLNPDLDATLTKIGHLARDLKKAQKADVIDLAVEMLPGDTPEEKKRKKLVILFITTWKDLKGEVKRIQQIETEELNQKSTHQAKISGVAKIASLAKGPLGLTTIAAVVIVGGITFLNASSIAITIKNKGCADIPPIANLPFPVPGLQLPKETIGSGSEGVAKVPPLQFTLDGTRPGYLGISSLGFSTNYALPARVTSVVFDEEPLIGKSTDINLGKSKTHELIVSCSS